MKISMYTMCLVMDGDNILLMNRPSEKGFPGYIAPGGKLEFPESLTEGAKREVLEETGLTVHNLIYKGLDEYVNEANNERYMVFNYITNDFEGELLHNPPEGELKWVSVNEAVTLPMQSWFRERLPLFFQEGTFEKHVRWDEKNNRPLVEKVTSH